MEFLPAIAGAVLPSILGPLSKKIFGGGMSGNKRLLIASRSGMGLRRARGYGNMIGGKRKRKYYRGKGFKDTVKKFASRVYELGKKGYNLYNNKAVRGLIQHGLNTYKKIRETGLGRKRRGGRMRYIIRNKVRGGAIDAPPGPLA